MHINTLIYTHTNRCWGTYADSMLIFSCALKLLPDDAPVVSESPEVRISLTQITSPFYTIILYRMTLLWQIETMGERSVLRLMLYEYCMTMIHSVLLRLWVMFSKVIMTVQLPTKCYTIYMKTHILYICTQSHQKSSRESMVTVNCLNWLWLNHECIWVSDCNKNLWFCFGQGSQCLFQKIGWETNSQYRNKTT